MTAVTATHRQRLEAIRDRTRTARSRRQHARQRVDAAREAGDVEAQAVAMLAFDEADGELQIAERLESSLLSTMAGIDGNGFGTTVFEDPGTIERLASLAASQMPIGRLDLGPLCSREEIVAMLESGSWGPTRLAQAPDIDISDTARTGAYQGIRPQLRRRLSVLDLLPSDTMDGSSFTYTQELGDLDSNAREVSEGAIKPAAEFDLADAEVVAETIAHWVRMKRAQLADVPALGTTATTRLIYGVLRRLENQVIAGDGTGVNIRGLLNTNGLGAIPFDAAPPLTDLALDGITATFLSDADPTGVICHPSDVGAMLKATSEGSGQRLDSGGAFASVPTTIWGLPLVISKAVEQGTAIVGDFTQATVFVREAPVLRISDSDQDAFVRNLVVYLAEGRFGLAVWAPAAFTVVHLK